ncbi:MAG: hypothetical protein IPL39_21920 [Opitutaceae bacterium]|nr:hypothetical protein [Opitutaceae bacterium]
MKIRKRRYLWAGPLLITVTGILYLTRTDINERLRTSWIVMTALATALAGVGIWRHFFVNEDPLHEDSERD